MGVPIALKLIVQIRMRIKVHDGEILVPLCNRPQNWISDGVIAAQAHRTLSFGAQNSDGTLDLLESCLFRKRKITGIPEPIRAAQVHAVLCPQIG